jgi:dihydropteroate synthase
LGPECGVVDPLATLLPRRDPLRRTRLLGVLNLTPDSFYDGGRDASPEAAAARARAMVDAGADALDLGAESSLPGAAPVSEREELDRLSVDTVKAGVARRALAAGARIVNDISALTFDPEMAAACAEAGAAVILMHMRGSPRDMQTRTDYDDVVSEVARCLAERLEAAVRAGIPERNVLLDPGIGFAKTADQSLELLRRLPELLALGRPVVVGASRKSFLSRYSGDAPAERLPGTLAAGVLAVQRGAHALRVHDVDEHARALRAAEAVLGGARDAVEEPC